MKEQIQALKSQLATKEKFIEKRRKLSNVFLTILIIFLTIAFGLSIKSFLLNYEFRQDCIDHMEEDLAKYDKAMAKYDHAVAKYDSVLKALKKLDQRQDVPKKTTDCNPMNVGFISSDAIIENGAIVEPGAFIFPKANIREGAVGKNSVFSTLAFM